MTIKYFPSHRTLDRAIRTIQTGRARAYAVGYFWSERSIIGRRVDHFVEERRFSTYTEALLASGR